MTKKDYELIAAALWQSRIHSVKPLTLRQRVHDASIKSAAIHVAAALKEDNSRFDTSRFMEACGFNN